MTRPRWFVVLTLVSALASPASATQRAEDADAKEIAAYRLTSASLTKVMNVNRGLMTAMSQDPKVQEAMKIGKEIEALEKKDELTEADEKRLELLRERQDQL